MTLQAGQRKVKKGQTVEVPVYLIRGDNVSNMNFEVRYDPTVVEMLGESAKGSLLGSTLFESKLASAGRMRLGFAGAAGTSGTGPVAVLTLRAIGEAGRSTPLGLSVTSINRPDMSVPTIDLIDGSIEILPERQPWTALDALEALKMSVGKLAMDLRLDVNKDSDVTSLDSTLIQQEIIKQFNAR